MAALCPLVPGVNEDDLLILRPAFEAVQDVPEPLSVNGGGVVLHDRAIDPFSSAVVPAWADAGHDPWVWACLRHGSCDHLLVGIDLPDRQQAGGVRLPPLQVLIDHAGKEKADEVSQLSMALALGVGMEFDEGVKVIPLQVVKPVFLAQDCPQIELAKPLPLGRGAPSGNNVGQPWDMARVVDQEEGLVVDSDVTRVAKGFGHPGDMFAGVIVGVILGHQDIPFRPIPPP